MWRAVVLIGACVLAVPDSAECADPPKPLKAPYTKEEAKAAQEAWAKHLGKKVEEEIDIGGGLKMVFVLIPPGTFMMGSSEEDLKLRDETRASESEVPRHEVTITKAFYMGKYPVTQTEFTRLNGMENPSWFSADAQATASFQHTISAGNRLVSTFATLCLPPGPKLLGMLETN